MADLGMRSALVAERVTLDGKPATISGRLEPFAIVRALDGSATG